MIPENLKNPSPGIQSISKQALSQANLSIIVSINKCKFKKQKSIFFYDDLLILIIAEASCMFIKVYHDPPYCYLCKFSSIPNMTLLFKGNMLLYDTWTIIATRKKNPRNILYYIIIWVYIYTRLVKLYILFVHYPPEYLWAKFVICHAFVLINPIIIAACTRKRIYLFIDFHIPLCNEELKYLRCKKAFECPCIGLR